MNRIDTITAQLADIATAKSALVAQEDALKAELARIQANGEKLAEARKAAKANPRKIAAEHRAQTSAYRAAHRRISEANGGRDGARKELGFMSGLTTRGRKIDRMGYLTDAYSDSRFYFETEAAAEAATDQMKAWMDEQGDILPDTHARTYSKTF